MPAARRRPLPLGRMYLSELPALLGLSKATVYRRYRSSNPDARREWALRLDIRERERDGALHCDTVAAEQLRRELDAEDCGGHLALAPSRIAAPLLAARG